MRIGVTGGTGFIGQYMLRDYRDEMEFVVPVRSMTGVSDRSHTKYVLSDYSVESLKNIFKNCDAVIHLAAKGMPKNRDPLKMEEYIENTVVTAAVFEACRYDGIARVIQTSSKAVLNGYEFHEESALTEDLEQKPNDEYGVSKLCNEKIAGFYNEVYGMEIITYRMAEVCGIDLCKGMVNPFWKAVLNACKEKKSVPVYGCGKTKRDLIYVKDVTRALYCGLSQRVRRGIYHICTENLVTNLEIAQTFCEVFENDSGVQMFPKKPEWGSAVEPLKSRKTRKELGFVAEYSLKKIVCDIRCEIDNKAEDRQNGRNSHNSFRDRGFEPFPYWKGKKEC